MNKAFLCQIPLKKPELTHYRAKDNQKLQKNAAVDYPLLLLIDAYAKKDDHIRLILTYNNENEDLKRIAEIKEAVRKLQIKIGFQCDLDDENDVRLCHQPFEQSIDYQVSLFLELLNHFDYVEELYADISFGNKPTPIILSKLLEYLVKTRNIKIGHVIYANLQYEIPADDKGYRHGFVYDVTPLFSMSRQIDLIARSHAKNPDELLRGMLSF